MRPLDQPAALELLADRLTASDPSSRRSVDTQSLTTLCHRLDGVPLALELAAAECRTLTPSELLVRLTRRREILADRVGLFDDRHRDLDRIIEWSWGQLSPLAQRVLARSTVVIGTLLDAAEAIASGGEVDEFDVVDALAELEDAGLIVQEPVDEAVRHRLLEPIRQHVATALDESEQRAERRGGMPNGSVTSPLR